MSSNPRKWLGTRDIAELTGYSRRHITRIFAAVPRRSWLYREGWIVKAGPNYRLLDCFPLRHFILQLGLRARGISFLRHMIECDAIFYSTGRSVYDNPKATREIPDQQKESLRFRAVKLAAAALAEALENHPGAFAWEPGHWDKEDGTMVWHEGAWQLRVDHPAADALMQEMLAAHSHGSEYRAMLEEAAERQHSGEERRDDYYRELAESDYASTVVGK
jgi:cation transport regulator ChaB